MKTTLFYLIGLRLIFTLGSAYAQSNVTQSLALIQKDIHDASMELDGNSYWNWQDRPTGLRFSLGR